MNAAACRQAQPRRYSSHTFKRAADHSGLGLGICRRGAEAIGGTIQVRDLPGKRCVFTVQLPLAVEANWICRCPVSTVGSSLSAYAKLRACFRSSRRDQLVDITANRRCLRKPVGTRSLDARAHRNRGLRIGRLIAGVLAHDGTLSPGRSVSLTARVVAGHLRTAVADQCCDLPGGPPEVGAPAEVTS